MSRTAQLLSIGQVARLSGCGIDTIRYYERLALLPPISRSEGGQRQFDEEHVRRIRFIREARALGLTLMEVRSLLARSKRNAQDCGTTRALLSAHASELRRHIAALEGLEQKVRMLLRDCGDADLGNCRVIEQLLSGETARGASCYSDG